MHKTQLGQHLQEISELNKSELTELDLTGFIKLSENTYMPWNGYRIYRFYELGESDKYYQDQREKRNIMEGEFYARPYRGLGAVSVTLKLGVTRVGYVAIYKTVSRSAQVGSPAPITEREIEEPVEGPVPMYFEHSSSIPLHY